MSDICRWLGIDGAMYAEFDYKKKNETLQIKNRFVNRIKESIAPLVKSKKVKDVLRPVYYSLNAKAPRRDEVESDKSLVRELRLEFQEANERLRERFNLDLSSWEK